jgi:hypothetical protein
MIHGEERKSVRQFAGKGCANLNCVQKNSQGAPKHVQSSGQIAAVARVSVISCLDAGRSLTYKNSGF